jgi:hypothetical protein
MIEAIRARDAERADALAHAHTRQFRERFLDFLRTNYSGGFDLRSSVSGATAPRKSA